MIRISGSNKFEEQIKNNEITTFKQFPSHYSSQLKYFPQKSSKLSYLSSKSHYNQPRNLPATYETSISPRLVTPRNHAVPKGTHTSVFEIGRPVVSIPPVLRVSKPLIRKNSTFVRNHKPRIVYTNKDTSVKQSNWLRDAEEFHTYKEDKEKENKSFVSYYPDGIHKVREFFQFYFYIFCVRQPEVFHLTLI